MRAARVRFDTPGGDKLIPLGFCLVLNQANGEDLKISYPETFIVHGNQMDRVSYSHVHQNPWQGSYRFEGELVASSRTACGDKDNGPAKWHIN
jgi:hypothetical protein